MNSHPIAFFDSGIGGLPYLAWAKEHLPHEHFVYLGDTAHFPYGEKSPNEVRSFVLAGIETIVRVADPKLVVIACNTASVVGLAELRSRFKLPFVGVVPALKPAAERSTRRRIALASTDLTAENGYTDALVREFAADCEVVRVAERGLVRFVENEFAPGDEEAARSAIRPVVESVLREGADSLVLACTHFTLLDAAFRRELGESVAVIDSREGVGRQLMRLLEREGLSAGAPPSGGTPCDDLFYVSGKESERYRTIAAHYGLSFGGSIR